jgi:Xaa-Pro aminopeptidase
MRFVDASQLIREVRMLKSAYEVSCIRRAALIQDRMAARVREVLKPGMTELELAAEIEAEARRHGHQGFIRARRFNLECFYGHLLSGENGAVPSWMDSPTGGTGLSPAFGTGLGARRIQANEPVMLDYAGAVDGYHCDQARVFALGPLPEDMVRGHTACIEILEEVVAGLRPGAKAGALFARARAAAERLGYADRFMNTGPAQVAFVGHGVGVELDEIPYLAANSSLTIEADMVLAVEPKIVFPGRGIVGVEDTVRVTTGDPEYLTVTPRELAIL